MNIYGVFRCEAKYELWDASTSRPTPKLYTHVFLVVVPGSNSSTASAFFRECLVRQSEDEK